MGRTLRSSGRSGVLRPYTKGHAINRRQDAMGGRSEPRPYKKKQDGDVELPHKEKTPAGRQRYRAADADLSM
jgi:hypothetical protein